MNFKVRDQVVIFLPEPDFYADKSYQGLADPTSVGSSGVIIAITTNAYNEEVAWVRLDDGNELECYEREMVPLNGYSAQGIRSAPALPNWVNDLEELMDRMYRHEWQHEKFQDCFGGLFTHMNEVRKHIEWLKANPVVPMEP